MNTWCMKTRTQYNTYFKRHAAFCQRHGSDPLTPTETITVHFLTDMFHSGYGYSAVNTTRAAVPDINGIASPCVSVHERRVQLEAEHSALHSYMGHFYCVKLLKNTASSETQLAYVKHQTCDALCVDHMTALPDSPCLGHCSHANYTT